MDHAQSTTGLTLSAIRTYPLKGASAVGTDRAAVTPRGLAGDRGWMVVDGSGRFVSQRTRPRLATVTAGLVSGGLALAAPGRDPLVCPVPDGRRRLAVEIWDDTVDAALADAGAARWLSAVLGLECRLVRQDRPDSRPLAGPRGRPGDAVSFADGSPVLLCGEAALADLNARLTDPVPMDRFRPNLVFAGGAPHAEDRWRRIRIGPVVFRNAGPCPRCTVTTVDQARGEPGSEPLATLATYRRRPGGVMFGVNLVPESLGTLRTGDRIEILD
jgi:hypothetical protein